MRGKWVGASMLAIVVAQGGAARAQAQGAAAGAPPRNAAIEEVVVTASKRSEKLQKVPQSIQVLDTKKLD